MYSMFSSFAAFLSVAQVGGSEVFQLKHTLEIFYLNVFPVLHTSIYLFLRFKYSSGYNN
jgi:hypothetical protein